MFGSTRAVSTVSANSARLERFSAASPSGRALSAKYNSDGEITLTKTSASIIDMIAGRDIVSDHTSINLGELLWGWGPWGWPVGIVWPPAVHPEPIWVSPPAILSSARVGVAEATSGVAHSDKGALLGRAGASLANHPAGKSNQKERPGSD